MNRKWTILLVLLLAAAATFAAPARAQGNPKAEPQGSAPPDEKSIHERWKQLSPEEQRRVLESYERWKKLPQDERELMKRRFERLEAERRRAHELLDEDERKRFEKLRDPERRQELTDRAKEAVRRRFGQLPPELRERIERELKSLPPAERERRARQFVKQHVEGELKSRLARKVESGELSREAVEELRRLAAEKEGDPRARLELLRRFIVEHPEAFRLTPEQVERLKNARDPDLALRLLERLRQRAAGAGERRPLSPRPLRDRDGDGAPDRPRDRPRDFPPRNGSRPRDA